VLTTGHNKNDKRRKIRRQKDAWEKRKLNING